MITDHQEEHASLYALGLLESAEVARFENELASSPRLRALTRDFIEVCAALALTIPQIAPPPVLKSQVLAMAGFQEASTPRPTNVVPFSVARFLTLPWAAAAVLALAATWFATQNAFLRSENLSLVTETQLAEVAYRMSQAQLAERSMFAEKMISELGQKLQRNEDLSRLKITALASLAGNTTEAKVIAVWDPEQQTGLLSMEKLPPIADTQDYQIWIVDPAYQNPVNGGVFHVSSDGKIPALAFKPDQPVAQVAAFAISLEKKGGVPKAEGPIVLLGK
ncbi:anti-sigma factor [Oleiharenicola lentus]|uniref:anti-sigma factor n=1 Tax=Oleiharenicola lentus TaxID=2508720 RepID=UPI003F66A6E6